jgi:hypothetical protein
VIAQLQEENRQMKKGIEEHLDSCEEALENNKNMVKISLPYIDKLRICIGRIENFKKKIEH